MLLLGLLGAEAQKKKKNPNDYNPFESIGKKQKIVTAYGDRFVEVFDTDSVQRIGSVLFHTDRKMIVLLLNADSIFKKASDNTSSSRWYTVDPLADKFHEWSPYNFAKDNPLRFIDQDGREPEDWVRLNKEKVVFDRSVTNEKEAVAKYGKDVEYMGKSFKEKDASYYKDGSAFFTNETKAYNFMWQNSNPGDAKNEKENFAFVTKDGVAVLPVEGKTHEGKEFKNNHNTAETEVYKASGKGENLTVDFNGTKIKPIATAHTHPWSSPLAVGSHSPEDQAQIKNTGIKGIVFGPQRVYIATPSNPRPTPVGTLNNFLKDGFVIIPNIKKVK